MAYNYPNYFYPQAQAYTPAPAAPQQPAQTAGFVTVRNEAEARNYPVAYGNSVTFRDENAPYIYTKTMGFSQLDRPVFDKYKLVKEDAEQVPTPAPAADAEELEKLQKEIKSIWNEINELKAVEKYGA